MLQFATCISRHTDPIWHRAILFTVHLSASFFFYIMLPLLVEKLLQWTWCNTFFIFISSPRAMCWCWWRSIPDILSNCYVLAFMSHFHCCSERLFRHFFLFSFYDWMKAEVQCRCTVMIASNSSLESTLLWKRIVCFFILLEHLSIPPATGQYNSLIVMFHNSGQWMH